MLFRSLLAVASMATATAMAMEMESMPGTTTTQAATSMNLTEALGAQNKTLSTLNGLLAAQPALTSMLAMASGITILAPSNDAFSKVLSTTAGMALAKDPSMIMSLLEYHVVNASAPASAFTTTIQFLPTLLTNTTMTNVTGGQVVGGMMMDKKVMIMSGLKEMSTVSTADIMFTGGVIHIIDSVLTIPTMPSASAVDSELTALAGALKSTSLLMAVDDLKDVTIFAPSNAAFQKIGSAASSLSMTQLSQILEYHVINGTVGYSNLLMSGLANQSYPSLMGNEVSVLSEDSKVFANSAQVTITDIIVSNGVMHVIDNVLNPSNTTATPVPTATSQAVAFADVSSATNVPFTSGISATTTAPSASTATMKAGAQAARGEMSLAALLGLGVAVAAL